MNIFEVVWAIGAGISFVFGLFLEKEPEYERIQPLSVLLASIIIWPVFLLETIDELHKGGQKNANQ